MKVGELNGKNKNVFSDKVRYTYFGWEYKSIKARKIYQWGSGLERYALKERSYYYIF